jgi:hypothetical protein
MTAVAETESDPEGDVWHYVFPYYESQTVSDQPNSDIKEISAEINGDQITLSMTLWPGGTFTRGSNEYASYIMFFNTTDAYYMMTYSDIIETEARGAGMGFTLTDYNPPMTTGEVVVNGNTISVTMDKVGNETTSTNFYGISWIWEGYGAEQYNLDHWHDWVGDYDWDPNLDPESGDDGDGDGDGDDGDSNTSSGTQQPSPSGTPGFETIAVIASLGVAFIYLRKRK